MKVGLPVCLSVFMPADFLQAIRRSIKGERDPKHLSVTPKSALAILPPKKVVCPTLVSL